MIFATTFCGVLQYLAANKEAHGFKNFIGYMSNSKVEFLDLCRAVEQAAQEDLSDADRELLIILHNALSALKLAVEKALLNMSPEKDLPN